MGKSSMTVDAKIEVEGLIERFARNLDVYKRGDYREAHVRVEFIDPFFEILGWDVRNVQGYAEQYKDVIHEDAIKVSGATRAPDYCFRIGGVRKFFLEAKKPLISVKGDIGPAYQLRRYAWSAKLPLSILTDFEEFSVYDCRQRPKPADKASAGRVMYLTFDQYLVFGLTWLGSKSFALFFKVPKEIADQYQPSDWEPHRYENEWKQVLYKVDSVDILLEELTPLFEAAYGNIVG